MWEIRQIDDESGKELQLKRGFVTEEEAEAYLLQHYKYSEGVFIQEEKSEVIKFDEKCGQWIWYYSPKKKVYFPYGKILECSQYFMRVQTKENKTVREETPEFTKNKVENWFKTKKAYIAEQGYFVRISEYV